MSLLRNIRVLDLTRILAGPYATMGLGDLGAEVIKVERPHEGDETRRWLPPSIGEHSVYFLSLNRSKKSIAVDITKEKGQNVIRDLSAKLHVLLENYVPGKLSKYGLDYKSLCKINPLLVYCSISGFGQYGPYAHRPGFDSVIQAMGGLMNITGPENGEPCRVGVAVTDIITGLNAQTAILVALRDIEVNGSQRGAWIDCNLLSSQLAALSHIAANYLNAGLKGTKYGTGHSSIVPYQAFKTMDGYFVLCAGSDIHYRELCTILELQNDNPLFQTNKDRVDNRTLLVDLIQSKMSRKSNKEWESIFSTSNIASGPVNNFQDIFNDPHTMQRNIIEEMEHPQAGNVKVTGPPIQFLNEQCENILTNKVALPPPLLGQHTEEILREVLGYSDKRIQSLIAEDIIHGANL